MSWAAAELSEVDSGDERLNRQLVRIVENVSARPGANVPQASRYKAALIIQKFKIQKEEANRNHGLEVV